MRLLIALLISFSFIACSTVKRPDTDLCIVNAPVEHMKCYNLLRDYNDAGERDPLAKPSYREAKSVSDLNKYTCTDVPGLAHLKIYIQELRDALDKELARRNE